MDEFLSISHSTVAPLDPIFPIEVFEEVIGQARDDSASLRHLSMTCSTFLPRVRHHLFSSIRIKTTQQLESSGEFLDSHPWLIHVIQRVVLRIDISVTISNPTTNDGWRQYRLLHDAIPVHLLSRLPNLRSWSMGASLSPSGRVDNAKLSLHRLTLSCYQRYSVGIQNLEVSNIDIWNTKSDFIALVSAFTTIQTLSCSSIHFLTTKGHSSNPLYDSDTKMPRMAHTLRSLRVSVPPLAMPFE